MFTMEGKEKKKVFASWEREDTFLFHFFPHFARMVKLISPFRS